ncbi:MAG: hypothetical protein ACP6IQ_05055 [Candidatus Njordarchaeia archaeon]
MLDSLIDKLIENFPKNSIEIWKEILKALETTNDPEYEFLVKNLRAFLNGPPTIAKMRIQKAIKNKTLNVKVRSLLILLLTEIKFDRFVSILLNAMEPEDTPEVLHAVEELSELLDLLKTLDRKFITAIRGFADMAVMLLGTAAESAYKTFNLRDESIRILNVAIKAARYLEDPEILRFLGKELEEIRKESVKEE